MCRYLSAILVLLFLMGCASGKQAQRIDDLERRLSSVQRDQALSRDRLDEVNRLGNSLFLLQDRFEVMSLEIERLEAEMAALSDGHVIAQPAEAPRQEVSPAKPASRPEQVSAPARRDDPVALYRKAFDLLRQADYERSAPLFRQFVSEFPQHDLADNSLYWLAEIGYAQGFYREAAQGFQRVLDEYPRGNKVPDALLKKAFSLIELGERDTARGYLERILRDYAWSDPAEIARERLELLDAQVSGAGL